MSRLRVEPSPATVLLSLGALVLLGGCQDSGSDDLLTIQATGTVTGRLLFDANGNGTVDGADRPLQDWEFRLDQPAGGTVVSADTDAEGAVLFEEVPVGRLVPAVAPGDLGDTLSLVAATAEAFTLGAGEEVALAPMVTLPFHTVAEARDLDPETPVFVDGVALNTLPTPTERALHLRGPSRFLRVLSVDSGTVSLGDSVRVRGRTAVSQGVPVLDGVVVYRLASGIPPVPLILTTGEAAGARGGGLDAGLGRVQAADLLEVRDEGNEGVRLVVNDGTGPLTIHLRSFLNVDAGNIDVETQRLGEASGLLVPVLGPSGVSWELQPRTRQEITLVPIGN
jgi:hypothetical protein